MLGELRVKKNRAFQIIKTQNANNIQKDNHE